MDRRETEPPVAGAMSVCPGPDEYDSVLLAYSIPVTHSDQHLRTETFTVRLMRILSAHGFSDIHRLVLGKGPGGREMLSLTLSLKGNQLLSYRVTFPLGADPFLDPGWVAAELIRQSAAVRCSLRPVV